MLQLNTKWECALVVLLIAACHGYAQETTGQITGRVTDSSGSPIVGSSVKLENVGQGVARTAASGDDGRFAFGFVAVGRYKLTVSQSGFHDAVRPNLQLAAGQQMALPIQMDLAQVSQSLEVQSEVGALDLTSVEQRGTVNVEQVNDLPVQHQDWTNLLQLNAGTTKPPALSLVVQAHSTSGSGLNVNGLPSAGYSVTVDGTNASSNVEFIAYNAYQASNIINTVNNDAIAEVGVAKGIAPASEGNEMSGGVNIVTKSGTNEYHGSAYEINEVSAFDARNQFLTAKPRTTFNEYGASFGAPVLRNRLFFFGSWEGAHLVSSTLITGAVPSPYLLSIAPPVYSGILSLFPKAPQPAATPTATTSQFIGAEPTVKTDSNGVYRLDYFANPSNIIAFRYIRARPFEILPNLLPANARTYTGHQDAFNLTYTHSSARWTENARLAYNKQSLYRIDQGYLIQLPALSFGGFSTGGPALFPQHGSYITFQEGVAFSRGQHNIQFGGIVERQNAARYQTTTPGIGYSTLAQFLNNIPSSVTLSYYLPPPGGGSPNFGLVDIQYGPYVQDDWRITQNLTLNLGLRYDLFTVPQEYHGRIYNRGVDPNRPGLGFGFGPYLPADSWIDGDHNNFQPRVGLAYNLFGKSTTVIRAGFGLFTTNRPLIEPTTAFQPSPTLPTTVGLNQVLVQAAGLQYPLNPLLYTQQVGQLQAQGLLGTTLAVQSEPQNGDDPYSIQWTFGVQQTLPGSMTLEVNYNANRGLHEFFNYALNRPDRLTGISPVQGFGTVNVYAPIDRSKYAALQATLRKRLQKGLQFSGAFSWSKVHSFGDADLLLTAAPQDINNIKLDWGPAPFDIRLRFVGNAIWDIPALKLIHSNRRLTKLLFDGWQVSAIYTAQTGLPANITDTAGSYASARPDAAGLPQSQEYLTGYQTGVHQYLTAAAFIRVPIAAASSAQIRDGNLGRYAITTPGLENLDASLSKTFAMTEKVRLSLRADTFNTFNHTNLSGLVTTINTPGTFGQLTQATSRNMQLGARISF